MGKERNPLSKVGIEENLLDRMDVKGSHLNPPAGGQQTTAYRPNLAYCLFC